MVKHKVKVQVRLGFGLQRLVFSEHINSRSRSRYMSSAVRLCVCRLSVCL